MSAENTEVAEEFAHLMPSSDETTETTNTESQDNDKGKEESNNTEESKEENKSSEANNDNQSDDNEGHLSKEVQEQIEKEFESDTDNKDNNNKDDKSSESKKEETPKKEIFEDSDKAITDFHDKLTPAKQEEFKSFIDKYKNTVDEKYKDHDNYKGYFENITPIFQDIDNKLDDIEFITGTDKEGNPVKTTWKDMDFEQQVENVGKQYENLSKKMSKDVFEDKDGNKRHYGDSLETFVQEMADTSLARGGKVFDIIDQFAQFFLPAYKTDANGKRIVQDNKYVIDEAATRQKSDAFGKLLDKVQRKVDRDADLREYKDSQKQTESDKQLDEEIHKYESDPAFGAWFKQFNSKEDRKNELLDIAVRKIQGSGNKMPIEKAFELATKQMMMDKLDMSAQQIADIEEKANKKKEKPKDEKKIKKQQKPKGSNTSSNSGWDLKAEIAKAFDE